MPTLNAQSLPLSDPAPGLLVRAGASTATVTQAELLSAVGEFNSASIELIAWEFCLDVHAVQPMWDEALGRGLLAAGAYDELGEQPCTLTAAGRSLVAGGPEALVA